MKKIRLTESDLHAIIRDAVKRALAEEAGDGAGNCFGNGVGGDAQLNNLPMTQGVIRKGDPTLKRNKDEKNGSISMNRIK